MKKHIRLSSSIALLLVLSAPVLSLAANGDEEVKKQKLINKSYTVTADDKLQIENQFGNVSVATWDKNEITVDIEISARASTEERAQEIMRKLDVKDWREGKTIGFKTTVEEIHNDKRDRDRDHERDREHGDGDRAFYIDYVIHMPAGNRLQIENSFGKTMVPDFNGSCSLTSKFGSLNAGKLANVDLVDVEFGRVTIGEVTNGKVVFKFNKESRIGKVNGNVKITSEFSDNVQFNVADNIKELAVFESYSKVRMVVDKSLSAEIDVHTSFGSFRNESEFSIAEHKDEGDSYGPHFDKDYSGKAGEGRARIKIKSSFGTVRLSHNASGSRDDDRDKEKDKHKDKADKDEEKTT
ncbi:MAG: hypothetical protein JST68_26760 [Bacteroidetes bacterium]|nr:hypothetical protein [Bacteroidota bacterium]